MLQYKQIHWVFQQLKQLNQGIPSPAPVNSKDYDGKQCGSNLARGQSFSLQNYEWETIINSRDRVFRGTTFEDYLLPSRIARLTVMHGNKRPTFPDH